MMNKQACSVIVLLFVTSFISLQTVSADDKAKLSVSVTAETGTDGTIITRKSTTSEINSLEFLEKNLREIDHKYPGPQIPKNENLLKATSVDNSGTISLENGQRIVMEGVKCPPQGVTYLRKAIIGESDRVVYIPSTSHRQNPVRAYIWLADISLMSDPDLKKFKFEPAYSSLNEAALTSGWCVPEKSSSNIYNDRYEALSKMAPNR